MKDILVRAEKICKSFATVSVLKDISLGVEKGEILGIIGENGAGKSTLMKILSGIYEATSGELYIDGERRTFKAPADAKRCGVSIVPQEFNLCPDLTAAENVFLGAELLDKRGLVDQRKMRERASELLSSLGAAIDTEAKISALSPAQKQLIEICKAIAFEAKLLILDEPTTVLTKVEIDSLFRVMRNLKSQGLSLIYISHKLAEVKAVCDRVAILRDGRLVGESPIADITLEEMAQRMVGRELSDVFPSSVEPREKVLLEVEGLASPGRFDKVSFSIRAGEILGLAGLVGAGRTEIAEAILSVRPASGRVVVDGERLHLGRRGEAVEAGVGYLSEDRQGSGVMVSFSLAENATLVSLPRYSARALGFIDKAKERAHAEKWRLLFGIKAASIDQRLEQLSGGNQQKVSLAKSLDPEPKVLIVDEPTRGVDVGAKHEIYRLIHDLAEQGLAVLFISSELEEIIGMCSRVLVMREGRIAGSLESDEMSEENIMFLATGIREGAQEGVGA